MPILKTGLYINQESGISDLNEDWVINEIYCDGTPVSKSYARTNGFGMYAQGNSYYIDGVSVISSNSATNAGIVERKTDDYYTISYGSTVLDTGFIDAVNITLEDYQLLLAGHSVPGYTKFEPSIIYHIVDDVATAPVVRLNINSEGYLVNGVRYKDIQKEYNLLNNFIGYRGDKRVKTLKHNQLSQRTYTKIDCPQISVHDYTMRATEGSMIKLTYIVDTHNCEYSNNNMIGEVNNGVVTPHIFTVIIKDANGKELYKATTFAGVYEVEIGPFTQNESNITGHTWFSIEAIDWEGCGSAVDFIDIYFDPADYKENFLQITTSLLNEYGINLSTQENPNNTPITGYYNKQGITELMAYAKANGYNGVRFPEHAVIYIDYHKNIGTKDNIDLGSTTFYLAKKKNNVWTEVPIVKNTSNPDYRLNDAYKTTENGSSIPALFTTDSVIFNTVNASIKVDCDPIQWIMADGARLFRNTKAASLGKVVVFWKAEPNDKTDDGVQALNSDTQVPFNNKVEDDPDVEIDLDEGTEDSTTTVTTTYLRTYNGADDTKKAELKAGIYYLVYNTAQSGDDIIFPNDFTVDFNGTELRGIYCNDISSGHLVFLNSNNNTIIKNGKFTGLYEEYRERLFNGHRYAGFIENHIVTRNSVQAEGLDNIFVAQSDNCVFDNVESCWSLGYDARAFAGYNGVSSDYITEDPGVGRPIHQLGYIDSINEDTKGQFIPFNTEDCNLAPLSTVALEYDGAKTRAISLVSSEYYYPFDVKIKYGDDDPVREETCILFRRYYKGGYRGPKRPEVFIHFYDEDRKYISTIKTRLFYHIKRPLNCRYVRFTVYGVSEFNDGAWISYNIGSANNGAGTNAVFNAVDSTDRWQLMPPKVTRNLIFKDCYWHDTRTTALSVEGAKGVLKDNCKYERIADIPRVSFFVTKILGAFEDGRYRTDTVTIKNCKIIKNDYRPAPYDNQKDVSSVSLQAGYNRNFTFCNNNGMTYHECGRIDDAYVHDNVMPEFKICRHPLCPDANMIYRNNTVTNTLNVSDIGHETKPKINGSDELPLTTVMFDNIDVNTLIPSNTPTDKILFRRSKINKIKNGNVYSSGQEFV